MITEMFFIGLVHYLRWVQEIQYENLPIWGIVAFCFGVVFLIAAKRTSDMIKNNH